MFPVPHSAPPPYSLACYRSVAKAPDMGVSMNTVTFPSQGGIDRRRFLKGLALGGVVAGTGLWRLPVHAANPELPLLQRHTTP